jgi:RNA polymerase sigma factor (sigma-70 family)
MRILAPATWTVVRTRRLSTTSLCGMTRCYRDVCLRSEVAGEMEKMEIPSRQPQDETARKQPQSLRPTGAASNGCGSRDDVAKLLKQWRSRELKSVSGWIECRDVNEQQLEDIYQETTIALIDRFHHDEKHLRFALRSGIRMRALNAHRDERNHEEILRSHAPEFRLHAKARQAAEQPERAVLEDEDRLIVWEFFTELSETEQLTFELMAEGMSYNRIARVRGIELNEARRTVSACERKRKIFQSLYETGRLCGYRAKTIQSLKDGELGSQELASRAFAHLESCARCRAEHETNAERLRRSFRDQAAAILPGPTIAAHFGWPGKLSIRARLIQHRLLTGDLPFGGNGARERASALLTGGAVAKLTAGAATIALLAGGAIDATRATEHHNAPSRKPTPPTAALVPEASPGLVPASFAPRPAGHAEPSKHGPGHVVPAPSVPIKPIAARQHQPSGSAYIRLPVRRRVPARTTRPSEQQRGGGPFSP